MSLKIKEMKKVDIKFIALMIGVYCLGTLLSQVLYMQPHLEQVEKLEDIQSWVLEDINRGAMEKEIGIMYLEEIDLVINKIK
jgi:hypothetical protein